MNNLKIGDTFEYATRTWQSSIHTLPVQCIVLNTNVGLDIALIPARQCPECKAMIGNSQYNPKAPYQGYQILVGNKKLIIGLNNNCMPWFRLNCSESK